MRSASLPVLALALLTGAAAAGGAPSGSGMQAAHPAYTVCYPADEFHLCDVPDAPLHRPGWIPQSVPANVTLSGDGSRFAILVTPNVVPYRHAVAEASAAALAHCGREAGERVAARIETRERHAPENLASWRFGGRCE